MQQATEKRHVNTLLINNNQLLDVVFTEQIVSLKYLLLRRPLNF